MMSSFQIQLYSYTNGLSKFNLYVAYVTGFGKNSPVSDNPQHTESGIGLKGIDIVRINCSCSGSTSGWSIATSHSLFPVMKCDTLREVSIRELFVILSELAKLSLAHQLSSQKLILIPLPIFHRMHSRNCCRLLNMQFPAQESDFFGFVEKILINWILSLHWFHQKALIREQFLSELATKNTTYCFHFS